MLLDVGNSAVKWATEEDGVLRDRGRFYYRGTGFSRSADRAWKGLPAPRSLAGASVAGEEVEREISAWTGRSWGVEPCFVHASKQASGVTNGYWWEPESLGADRWAAMVAARHDTGHPVCIIDCGTAITLDVVDADGSHQGGLIAPGIDLMKDSLAKETAAIDLLPRETAGISAPFARSTKDGVNSGVMQMAGALIDRMMDEVFAAYGRDLQAVITGGDAGRILPLLRYSPRYDPDLVLKGVAILAREMLCGT